MFQSPEQQQQQQQEADVDDKDFYVCQAESSIL